MRPTRPLIALFLSLAVFLAAGWAMASAQQSNPPEPVDPTVLQLDAGEHLVGWLGESVSVQRIKRQHPAIESIQAWDALRQELHEPEQLVAGVGYLVTVREGEQLTWRRPLTPVKSRIQLRRGRNLVTWLGPDDWAIDRVALGIGRALVKAEWEGGEYAPSDSETEAPLPTLKRGTALWVEVSRTVNWLQPAGVMPTITFAGQVPEEVQKLVRRDTADIWDFYADEYGIQPDGAILTLYIATDPDSLVAALEKDGHETSYVPRQWHDSEGWASATGYVVQKSEQWEPDHESNQSRRFGTGTYGRAILAHEFYHSIQQQLSHTEAAEWMVEGDAQWVRARLVLKDTEQANDELKRYRDEVSPDGAVPLNEIEVRPDDATSVYRLGTIASWRLAARSGMSSLVEFWRALRPEPLGPLGRWQTNTPWQQTFVEVFGITVEEFYDEFADWRSDEAPISFRARVVGPDGVGLPYVKITARTEHLLEKDQYYYFEKRTDSKGQFEFRAISGGGVQWGVDLGSCDVYYSSSGAAYRWEEAEVVAASGEEQRELVITLTNNTCVWQVSGVLVDEQGRPLSNVRVLAETDTARVGNETEPDGTFEVTVPVPGSYRISTWLDEEECRVYHREGDTAGLHGQATMVSVSDRDVRGIRFRLADGLCSTKITGRLLGADGEPSLRVEVWASTDDGGIGGRIEADGTFSISVTEGDRYRVGARFDGCTVWYRRGGMTSDRNRATVVRVSDKGVSGIRFQLANGMCEHRISGKLLNADGSPHAGQWVRAAGRPGYGGAHTSADGSFSFAVPGNGSYRLELDFGDCRIELGVRGPTTNQRNLKQFRVSDADVTGIEFVLPEDPASFCD